METRERGQGGGKALVFGALLAAGIATASGAPQGPTREAGPAIRGTAPAAAARARQNCGTFWTPPVEDPEADVNPCPKGCERGERQLVNAHKQGDKTVYAARYQCYRIPVVAKRPPPDDSPFGRARAQIERPGAKPAGTIEPASGAWGVFARLKGPGFGRATGVVGLWYPNDDTSQLPAMRTSVTLGGRPGPDELRIQIPLDPARTGSRGDFSRGTLHIVLQLPSEKAAVYAGTYSVGGGTQSSSSGITGAPAAGEGRFGNVADQRGSVSTKQMAGAGTTISAVRDITPTTLTIAWKPVAGASGYTLHASAQGLNHNVAGAEVRQPGSVSGDLSATLGGLAPGVRHSVWVSVRYPDGTQGTSVPQAVMLANAENPQGFKAVPIGPGAVRLEWQPVPGAIQYRVEGANLPRMQTAETAVAVSNLSPATHEWTLITIYPAGVFNDLNATRLSASVDPSEAGRARYRITVNGFRVDQETMDDPLQRDGKGDEVYVAVKVEEFDRATRNRIGHALVKSPVFGDKNGFPTQTRVMAGSTGGSGGLRRGDLYPGANPAIRSRAPSSIDLPLLVWDGHLEAGKSALIIYPAIWEWDGEQAGERFARWLRNFDDDGFANVHGAITRDSVIQQFSASRLNVQTLDYAAAHATGATWINLLNSELSGDRPIGFSQVRSALDSIFTLGSYVYYERAIVLTRESIEGELAARNTSSYPPGTIATRYRDDPAGDGTLGGDYTLYLQVERLP